MHISLLFSLFISLPLSSAWTTTVTFQVYLQALDRNPIGILPLRNYYNPRDPTNIDIALVYEPYEHQNPHGSVPPGNRELEFQIYPARFPLPGLRPSRDHPDRFLAAGSCTNVPPGYCCRPFRPFVTTGWFEGLPPGAVAGFWGPPAHDGALYQGCYDEMLASYAGPRLGWGWHDPVFPPRISGASYIQCPSANIARGWGTVLAGFCMRLNRRLSGKREARSTPAAEAAAAKGMAPSNMAGWPDVVVFNGTTYTDDRRGDLVYRNAKGGWLNFRAS